MTDFYLNIYHFTQKSHNIIEKEKKKFFLDHKIEYYIYFR